MTLTYAQITQELYPAFMQLIQAQSSGLVGLPQKAAYAFGKSFAAINKHIKEHARLKNVLLEEFGLKDEAGNFKTIKVNNVMEYEFKDGKRSTFVEKSNELSKTEIDCRLYSISRQDLEQVNNFPIQLFPVLEEFGMISELHLETPKMTKVLN